MSVLDQPSRGVPLPLPTTSSARGTLPRWTLLASLVLVQVALAIAMQASPVLGLAHLGAVVVAGLYAAAKRDALLLTCTCAYLVGSEVLWRQVRAPIFYQAAPYTLILLSGIGLVMLGRLGRDARTAILYIGLLLPSAVATVRVAGTGSREMIAFALSGPVALAVFVAFMSQMQASPAAYRKILWTVVLSAVAPLTVAVTNIRAALADARTIKFSDQSNFITSGGFGPVQVSAVLGLGVLAAVLLTMTERDRMVRLLAGFLATAFAVQSLLTVSRGGMTATAIGLSALAISQANN